MLSVRTSNSTLVGTCLSWSTACCLSIRRFQLVHFAFNCNTLKLMISYQLQLHVGIAYNSIVKAIDASS